MARTRRPSPTTVTKLVEDIADRLSRDHPVAHGLAAGPLRFQQRQRDVALAAAEEAKRAIARAVARAIMRTGTPYKALADKAQVSRWCREHEPENPVLHKLWVCPQLRKALVIALAEEAGMAVEITVRDGIA